METSSPVCPTCKVGDVSRSSLLPHQFVDLCCCCRLDLYSDSYVLHKCSCGNDTASVVFSSGQTLYLCKECKLSFQKLNFSCFQCRRGKDSTITNNEYKAFNIKQEGDICEAYSWVYCGLPCLTKDKMKMGTVARIRLMQSRASMICQGCRKSKPSMKKCTKCRNVYYCSISCQRKDWSNHNSVCK